MSSRDLEFANVFYPETDGEPMAESDLHRDLMFDLIDSARNHFLAENDVYVSGNLLVYFEEGNPRMCVAPDFFFVRGVSSGRRRIYKVWEEASGPQVVVEVTSPTTHLEALGKKRAVYEQLGVREYFLFDPEGKRFQPPMRAFRLSDGALEQSEVTVEADGSLVVMSEVMGLQLRGHGDSCRWVDPQTGKALWVPGELRDRAERAEARAQASEDLAEASSARAETAEAEVARLRAELAKLRGDEDAD